MSNTLPTLDRVIRVFVSSTFRDMQAERDELVLKIFPQLRRLCEERGVTWGEIDLRWGITEEQSQRGEVLSICLEEIRRCRPYFIGLLGERYGWIPDAIPTEVLEREPWIREHADGTDEKLKKSVTELEILHGVLNNPEMADHAFFYFRDPAYVETVPQESRNDFTSEDTACTEKLKRVKEDIRRKHRDGKLKYEPRENYRDAKALGEQVLADFTALIDSLYPEGTQPSPLDRERMDHEAFARSRAGVYIGRQEYFDRLDAHVASNVPPLVVLGESGGGKSALLSNWALRYREQHPADFLLLHFIGASPDSANAIGLLRRIMLELKQRFDLTDEIPAEPAKIREAFPNWLTQVAGRSRIVLVLDALNQLEDLDNAPDLGWLPRVFPKYCRVIVSTLPGRSLKAIEQRGWLEATPPLEVHPLDEPERRRLIHDFLKQYTRDLGPARTDRVARAPQTANPLYLRVMLNELRVFGLHEKLNERIDWYLEAQDPNTLYRKVIVRWEEAYDEGSGLMRNTLSLLWAARRGLSETELLEALGQPGRPFPRAMWSPLFLAMSDALVSRSGLLTFAHDFLRTAASDAFLPNDSQQQVAHRHLAGYFQQQSTWGNRKLDEFPWQLASARDWHALHDVLTEHACFLGLRDAHEYELLGYWLQLKPEFNLASSYTAAFTRWEQDDIADSRLSYVANQLATFLDTAACYSAAEPLMRRALAIDEHNHGAQNPNVAVRLDNLGQLLQATNRLVEAETLIRRALAIDERHFGQEHPNVAIRAHNLALLLMTSNRLDEAEPLMRRTLAIDEKYSGPRHPNTAAALGSLASLFMKMNRPTDAEPLIRRALAIDEEALGPDHPSVANRLNSLFALLLRTNRIVEAEPLVRRALAIDESALGQDHPNVAIRLGNLASLLQQTNRLAEAEPLIRRALAINEKIFGPDHPTVAGNLQTLASLFQAANQMTEAEPLLRRALTIVEKSYGQNHPDVATSLACMAHLLKTTSRFMEAEPLLRRVVKILENSGGEPLPEYATALNNLAQLMKATNRLAEAEPLMRRALAIDEQSYGPEHPKVAIRLNNIATLLQATNRLAEAEPLMRRMIVIFAKFTMATRHEHPHLRAAITNYGGLLVHSGQTEEQAMQRVRSAMQEGGL